MGYRGVEGETCGTRGRGGCHMWDMGAWRMPCVGYRGMEGEMCGTGAWRVSCVGYGGVEGATCGTHQRPHMLQGAMPCQEPSGP